MAKTEKGNEAMRITIPFNTKFRIRKRVEFGEFFLNLATIFIILYAFLEHMSISIPFYSSFKLPMLYVAGISLLPQFPLFIKSFWKKKNFVVLVTVMGICLFSFVSMKINQQNTNVALRTWRYILYLIELFVMVVSHDENRSVDTMLHFLFVLLAILVVLTDLLILTSWITFQDGNFPSYLLGTKFNVSYAHMGLLTLWVMKDLRINREDKVTKIVIIVGSVMAIVVSAMVGCMTGLLGTGLFFILLMKMPQNRNGTSAMFTAPAMITVCLIGSVLFVVVIDGILSIPFVAMLITQVLDRSLTLTGRLLIYNQFLSGIEGHWLCGYGIGSGFQAASSLFGFANVQNALLDWVFQAGLPCTVLLTTMIVLIFKRIRSATLRQQKVAMPLILLVYIYVIMGTVEVTFDMSFLMWLAVLFVIVNMRLNTACDSLNSGEE